MKLIILSLPYNTSFHNNLPITVLTIWKSCLKMWVQASIPLEVSVVTSYGWKGLCDLDISTHAVDMTRASFHSPTMHWLLLYTALARNTLTVYLSVLSPCWPDCTMKPLSCSWELEAKLHFIHSKTCQLWVSKAGRMNFTKQSLHQLALLCLPSFLTASRSPPVLLYSVSIKGFLFF